MTDRDAKLRVVKADRGKLVQALEDAGATVSGTSVFCPFHPDKHASGSVHQNDGTWLYTCHTCNWNRTKSTGDVVDVVRKACKVDFKGALAALGIEASRNHTAAHKVSSPETARSGPSPDGDKREVDAGQLADEAARRLQTDGAALEKLWRTRAVDADTAKRFRVGIDAKSRFWTFPVSDGGRMVAVKHHRADPASEPKCFWFPKGAKPPRLFPVCLDFDGPVWVCPGELKALAVIAAGRSAVGITGGEKADLPAKLPELLRGRLVALAADDDEAGQKWAGKSLATLGSAEIDTRAVDLGLSVAAGLKDVGDLIRQWAIDDAKGPEAIGAALDDAYERSEPWSDPWTPFTLVELVSAPETWLPVEHVPTGFVPLDEGLHGGLRVGCAHLLAGRSGRGKTQVATAIGLNAALAGFPVGIVSLELDRRDVARLVVAQLVGVQRSILAQGSIPVQDKGRVQAAGRRAAEIPLVVVDDEYWAGVLTRTKLAEVVAAGRRCFGWKLVVVDYLGLVANEADERSDSYGADCENSAALKRMARHSQVAILVVLAIRKRTKAQEEKPLGLDDILGDGRIGYDAVNAITVECEQPESFDDNPSGTIMLTALKTRFSGMGARREQVELEWLPAFGAMKSTRERWHWQEGDAT